MILFNGGQDLFIKLGSTSTPWSGPFRDHGPRPWSQSPSEHCKPYAWRIFCVRSALFGIWSRRPRVQGVGVAPCLLISLCKNAGGDGKFLEVRICSCNFDCWPGSVCKSDEPFFLLSALACVSVISISFPDIQFCIIEFHHKQKDWFVVVLGRMAQKLAKRGVFGTIFGCSSIPPLPGWGQDPTFGDFCPFQAGGTNRSKPGQRYGKSCLMREVLQNLPIFKSCRTFVQRKWHRNLPRRWLSQQFVAIWSPFTVISNRSKTRCKLRIALTK